MSVILFADNLLERGTVTTTNAAADKPATRLYDRDRALQCEATGAGAWEVEIDLGVGGADPASAIALINHNVEDNVLVYSGTSYPASDLAETFSPVGTDPFYGTFTSPGSRRYWRIRFAAFADAAALGEVLLGVPHTISLNPSWQSGKPHTLRNMTRDLSQGGYTWSVKKGEPRARLPFAWPRLSDANLAILEAASTACEDGVKPLLVRDPDSVLRWMVWETLNIEPSAHADDLNEVAAAFVEAL